MAKLESLSLPYVMQKTTVSRPRLPAQTRDRNARTSIWLILISEIMLFFGLLSSFFFLRGALDTWGPPTGGYNLVLPLINTAVLLASAGSMHLAYRSIQQGRVGHFERLLTLTMLLGAAFIGGQIYEFATIGFAFQDGAYAAIVLLTIGTHAAHVAVGVLLFVVVHIRASFGLFSAHRHLAVELCALYWYFVALIWLVIFATLYFL